MEAGEEPEREERWESREETAARRDEAPGQPRHAAQLSGAAAARSAVPSRRRHEPRSEKWLAPRSRKRAGAMAHRCLAARSSK